jgi:hypothetical protein
MGSSFLRPWQGLALAAATCWAPSALGQGPTTSAAKPGFDPELSFAAAPAPTGKGTPALRQAAANLVKAAAAYATALEKAGSNASCGYNGSQFACVTPVVPNIEDPRLRALLPRANQGLSGFLASQGMGDCTWVERVIFKDLKPESVWICLPTKTLAPR